VVPVWDIAVTILHFLLLIPERIHFFTALPILKVAMVFHAARSEGVVTEWDIAVNLCIFYGRNTP
jgi:hypothetical protein